MQELSAEREALVCNLRLREEEAAGVMRRAEEQDMRTIHALQSERDGLRAQLVHMQELLQTGGKLDRRERELPVRGCVLEGEAEVETEARQQQQPTQPLPRALAVTAAPTYALPATIVTAASGSGAVDGQGTGSAVPPANAVVLRRRDVGAAEGIAHTHVQQQLVSQFVDDGTRAHLPCTVFLCWRVLALVACTLAAHHFTCTTR